MRSPTPTPWWRRPEPGARVFVLMRHGESLANALDIRQGVAQFPLTKQGLRQAVVLAQRWRAQGWTFDRILTSPLQRAFHTALIFSRILGVPHIEVEDVWEERRIGRHTLRPALHVAQEPEAEPLTRFTPVGGRNGESPWDLHVRAMQAWSRLLRYGPGRYLVVTHGGLLNTLCRLLLNLSPQAGFAGPRVRFPNLGYVVWYVPPCTAQPRLAALHPGAVLLPPGERQQ